MKKRKFSLITTKYFAKGFIPEIERTKLEHKYVAFDKYWLNGLSQAIFNKIFFPAFTENEKQSFVIVSGISVPASS